MIHWQVGEVNFYKVYKRRKVEELVERRLKLEQAWKDNFRTNFLLEYRTMTSLSRYIVFCAAALATMVAGSQCVHEIYKPLDDLEDLVEQKLKERRGELQKK